MSYFKLYFRYVESLLGYLNLCLWVKFRVDNILLTAEVTAMVCYSPKSPCREIAVYCTEKNDCSDLNCGIRVANSYQVDEDFD